MSAMEDETSSASRGLRVPSALLTRDERADVESIVRMERVIENRARRRREDEKGVRGSLRRDYVSENGDGEQALRV